MKLVNAKICKHAALTLTDITLKLTYIINPIKILMTESNISIINTLCNIIIYA